MKTKMTASENKTLRKSYEKAGKMRPFMCFPYTFHGKFYQETPAERFEIPQHGTNSLRTADKICKQLSDIVSHDRDPKFQIKYGGSSI